MSAIFISQTLRARMAHMSRDAAVIGNKVSALFDGHVIVDAVRARY
jgi:hypothetical protein